MKRCAICGHPSPDAASTCPRCGEGSWDVSDGLDVSWSQSIEGDDFGDAQQGPEQSEPRAQQAPQAQTFKRKGRRR